MHTFEIETCFLGLEEYFGGSEPLATYEDLATIWQFVIFLTCVTLLSVFLGSLVIIDNKAHFLFDVFDNLNFCVCGEAIASVVQNLLKVGGDVSTSKVNPLNCVRNGITFINRDCVRNTVA